MEGIFELLIDLMKDSEKINHLSSEEKQNRGLLQIKSQLESSYGGLALEAQMILLDVIIDGLIELANKEFSLKKLGKQQCMKCLGFKK